MNKLIKAIQTEDNKTARTANGAVSNKSTLNSCVDLFGKIGAMRNSTTENVIRLFTSAFAEDKLKALKILFWARDIRGGAGERKVFRQIFKYLGECYPKFVEANLHLVTEYGRFDDLFELRGTPVWPQVISFVREILVKDVESDKPSLAAKWMPSNNTSSNATRSLAIEFQKALELTPRQYRQMLSILRAKIKVVERDICSNHWHDINYQSVPSRAAMIYRKAFARHDEVGYKQYLEDVASGKKEIKTATLYPYDIVRNVLDGKYDETLNLQWNNLPNYVEPFNGIVVCDVSGSMTMTNQNVRPIDVAISLAIYIAERNTGDFHNTFITFSAIPSLETIRGSNINEKVKNLSRANWDQSTNLQSVFDLILSTAIKNRIGQDEMPRKLFIVSDMQFDSACGRLTNFEVIDAKYKAAGYERPQLVFWNVDSHSDFPMTVDNNNTCFVSGASPAILKAVLGGDLITPIDVMDQVIESKRYSLVKLP